MTTLAQGTFGFSTVFYDQDTGDEIGRQWLTTGLLPIPGDIIIFLTTAWRVETRFYVFGSGIPLVEYYLSRSASELLR